MGFRAPLNAIIFIIAFIVAGYKAIWKSYVCINACWADVREMHSEACWISKAVQITFTHISMLHAEKISMWFGTVLCSDRMASARIALLFWFRQTFKIDMFRKLGDKNIFRRNSRDVANWGNGWAAGECVCVRVCEGHCSLWCGNNKFIRQEPPQASAFPRALCVPFTAS